MNDIGAAIRFYRDELGFNVIPIQYKDKTPLLNEWQKRSKPTDEEIQEWIRRYGQFNIALVCGASSNNAVALDIDKTEYVDKIFPDGQFDKVKEKTFVTETGRGYHIVYYLDLLPKSRSFDINGEQRQIDVRSDRKYILLPPSLHPNGKTYTRIGSERPSALTRTDFENGLDEILMRGGAKKREPEKHDIEFMPLEKWHKRLLKTGISDGANRMMWQVLCPALVRAGWEKPDIIKELLEWQDKCLKNGLEERNMDASKISYQVDRVITEDFYPLPLDLIADRESKIFKEMLKREVVTSKEWKLAKKLEKAKAIVAKPIEEREEGEIDINTLLEVFHKWIYIEEDINVTIPFAFFISNFSEADPDILGIIAPSGSNKTEILRTFGEQENKYTYPLSSLTAHTFISGKPGNPDLAPMLQGRIIIIKDFTTLLAKREDERGQIFADFRELTDGYMKKDYGSGEKKMYDNLHSSIMFGCTEAIERYHSIYTSLGQRMVFYRPYNNPKKARKQALANVGKEKEMRTELNKNTIQFLNKILKNIDRVKTIGQQLPEEYKERLGDLVDFTAIARTHVHHDYKGEVDELPKPEFPTRLFKTCCKIIEAHALLYCREVTEEDVRVGLRLVWDNIPWERRLILELLSNEKTPQSTSYIAKKVCMSPVMCKRRLDELTVLRVVNRYMRGEVEEVDGRSDSWSLNTNILENVNISHLILEAGKNRGLISPPYDIFLFFAYLAFLIGKTINKSVIEIENKYQLIEFTIRQVDNNPLFIAFYMNNYDNYYILCNGEVEEYKSKDLAERRYKFLLSN